MTFLLDTHFLSNESPSVLFLDFCTFKPLSSLSRCLKPVFCPPKGAVPAVFLISP